MYARVLFLQICYGLFLFASTVTATPVRWMGRIRLWQVSDGAFYVIEVFG